VEDLTPGPYEGALRHVEVLAEASGVPEAPRDLVGRPAAGLMLEASAADDVRRLRRSRQAQHGRELKRRKPLTPTIRWLHARFDAHAHEWQDRGHARKSYVMSAVEQKQLLPGSRCGGT
jgi:hypothetical protein